MNITKDISKRLVDRAIDGDREALDSLFQRCIERVHELVRRRLGISLRSRLETQDVAQTALAEAFRDLSGFEWRGEGSFDRWLNRVIENKIRQKALFYRRQKRDIFREIPAADALAEQEESHVAVPEPIQDLTPSRILGLRQDVERVQDALAHLPPLYAEVIRLARIDRLPYREIGQRLDGRSEDAVRKLLNRALAKLTGLVTGPMPPI